MLGEQKDREGFYRFLCRRHGIIPKKPSDLPSGSPSEKVCLCLH